MVPWVWCRHTAEAQRRESLLLSWEKGLAPWKRFQWFLIALKPWESKIVPVKSLSHPTPASLASLLFFTHTGLQCLELSMFFPSAVFRGISCCVPVPILSSVLLWFSLRKKSHLKCNFLREAFLMPHSRSGFLCYKLSRAPTLPSKALAIIHRLSW